jgi:hypothetical protein
MWMLTVREWCLPLERAGVVSNRGETPTGAVGDAYDPDCALDLDELMEEYAEYFGTDEGQFDFSIGDQGPCLRFLMYREYERYADFYGPYVDTPSSVFRKILPDVDLDDVRLVKWTG